MELGPPVSGSAVRVCRLTRAARLGAAGAWRGPIAAAGGAIGCAIVAALTGISRFALGAAVEVVHLLGREAQRDEEIAAESLAPTNRHSKRTARKVHA